MTEFSQGMAWWISVIEIPLFTGLFVLFWKERKDIEKRPWSFQKYYNARSRSLGRNLNDFRVEVTRDYARTSDLKELENRHVEELAKLESQSEQTALTQINESLRAEVASTDKYVRRMRPTFGYLIALTWAAQMFALAWVIIFETEKADLVIKSMESLGMIWAVGLSVMGIYVYKRSEDKKLQNGLGGRYFKRQERKSSKTAYNS